MAAVKRKADYSLESIWQKVTFANKLEEGAWEECQKWLFDNQLIIKDDYVAPRHDPTLVTPSERFGFTVFFKYTEEYLKHLQEKVVWPCKVI